MENSSSIDVIPDYSESETSTKESVASFPGAKSKRKYYLDVGRREDAFDLSGPYHPERDPPPLKPGPSMHFEGLHDRSLKHYYRNNRIKQQIQKMSTPKRQTERDNQVRYDIEMIMAKQHYKLKPKISPYAVPLIRPRSAHMTVDEYFKTKRGARRRKNPPNVVGRPPRLMRRAPPQSVPPDERERLVNMATKLIVATETVALPLNRRVSRENQTDPEESFPDVDKRDPPYRRRQSSLSDPGPGGVPHPPDGQPHSRRGDRIHKLSRLGKAGSIESFRSGTGSNLEDVQSQMEHLNVQKRGDSYVLSPRTNKRPVSAVVTTTSGIDTGSHSSRPKSAGHRSPSPHHDDYNYDNDEFYERSSTEVSPINSPRDGWTSNDKATTAEISTQTVEHRGTSAIMDQTACCYNVTTSGTGTQTVKISSEEEDIFDKVIRAETSYYDKWNSNKRVRDGSESRKTSTSTHDAETGTESDIVEPTPPKSADETQTRRRDLEPKVLTYEVYVVTGDKLGGGTTSEVKLNLFGEYGDTGERPLLRSKTNRSPFQRKQVDIFAIDSHFLGKLDSVRVGHNGTALGTGWFLDKVVIKEGSEATRAFEFSCNRWLSSRDDDGQIVRDLPVSRIIPALDVPVPAKSKREQTYFKYRPASAGKADSEQNTVSNRPTSGPKRSQEDLKRSENDHGSRTPEKDPSNSEKRDFSKDREYFDPNDSDKESSEEELPVTKLSKTNSVDKSGQNSKSQKSKSKSKDTEGQKSKMFISRKAKSEERPKSDSEKEVESKSRSSPKNMKVKRNKTTLGNLLRRQKSSNSSSEISSAESEKESESEQFTKKSSRKDRKEKRKKNRKQNYKTKKEDEDTRTTEITNNEKSDDVQKANEGNKKTNSSLEKERTRSRSPEKYDNKPDRDPVKAIKSSNEIDSSDAVKSDKTSDDSESESHNEDRGNKDSSSDDEKVDLSRKDTSKKEIPEAERKKSLQDEYMAGFMAGIKAKKEEKQKPALEDNEESRISKGPTIHQASEDGDLNRIKELVAELPELKSKPDERGWTPLHTVAAFGHLDALKWLSVNGVNLKEETPTGYTPIHLAAMNGHVKCIMVLSAMGCPLNSRTVDEFTPLHLAAMSGHVECVKWLLANRAKHDLVDSNGRTPLNLAEEYKHEDCVVILGSLVRRTSTNLVALVGCHGSMITMTTSHPRSLKQVFRTSEKEMKRKDSVINMLRNAPSPRHESLESGESVTPSKGADSGVGGLSGEEDSWISDTEDADSIVGRGDRPQSGRHQSLSAAKPLIKASKQAKKDEEMLQEKKRNYEKQKERMQRRESSFLDSIRMDVDNPIDEEF